MSKAAFCLLWCFVFVVPFEEYVQLPFPGSFPRLVGLAASAVGILHILARRRIRPLLEFHVFAVLFVLWAGMSSFWSIDPETTRTRFRTLVQLGVLVWLIWEIAWSSDRQRALLQAYVLGGAVCAVGTIYNYLSGVGYGGRFTALNQNDNDLGLILALGLPMAWYLALAQPQRRIAWVWQLYVPLAITAILLTASRMASLAALVALAIIPWTLGSVRLKARAALCALVVGSLVLAGRFVPEASLERLRTTRAEIAAGSFGGRGAIWRAGLDLAREHPLAGVGAGAFDWAVEPTLGSPRSAHQVLLEILVGQGAVGLLLFLAMVASVIKPLRHLPPLQRRFAIVLLLTLAVGSLSISWLMRKQLWFALGVLAAQAAQPTPSLLSWRLRREKKLRATPGGRLLDAAGRREESS